MTGAYFAQKFMATSVLDINFLNQKSGYLTSGYLFISILFRLYANDQLELFTFKDSRSCYYYIIILILTLG